MARVANPPGGLTPFDHQPELWAAFNRYYGTLWSDGVVDDATKEVGRLRNARVTGCGICKNLRFASAREQGLDEEHVTLIDDGYADSELTHRWKLAIRLADALIADARVDADLRAALLDEFTDAQIVELTATIATAIAFSKASVAFGAPDEMPLDGRAHADDRRRRRALMCRRPSTADDLILVSVDDHICEPADMFDAHVPAKLPRPSAARRRGSRTAHSSGTTATSAAGTSD